MRKFCLLVLFCFLISCSYAQINMNANWTWMAGEKHIPMRPIPGIKSIAAPENNPAGRKDPISWLDQNGGLWLFGGYGHGSNAEGYFNDLWKYDGATNQWTWINGSNSVNAYGVYGVQGIAAESNNPGGREGSVGWVGNDGSFYLFGGYGYGVSSFGRLNDLWKYNPVNNQWTWINGSNTVNTMGVYGSLGIAGAVNWPGARNGGTLWKGNDNKIWLFGGDGYASSAFAGRLNDMWKYDPATNQWTWMKGSNTINAITDATGPGGRNVGNTAWKDNNGNLYLYGGASGSQVTNPPCGGCSYYTLNNELWKYNPASNSWTQIFVPGGMGVNRGPGRRYHCLTWTDASGNFWLSGGYGNHNYGSPEWYYTYRNDLWKFNPSTIQWETKINGDQTGDTFLGTYGTQGLADIINKRGGRASATCWINSSGKLYSFGGEFKEYWPLTYRNDIWTYDPTSNLSTWMKGDSAATIKPIYGAAGVANATNRPGERKGAQSWSDNNGNLWMFSGNNRQDMDIPIMGMYGDMWKYNISSQQWVWVRNSGFSFGVKGVPSPTNYPPGRANGVTWLDNSNNAWLFGGITASWYYMNDLWKYDMSSDQWVWMHGSSSTTSSTASVYGIQGVPNPANMPSSRQATANWKSNDGNIWLFGSYSGSYQQNDLWRYDIASNQWTWMSGDNVGNQPGVYGTQGISSPTNKPGTRGASASWKDNAGNFWLFGGYTGADNGSSCFNDLWKYNVTTNQWTWINGDNTLSNAGVYGSKGTPASSNKPGSRKQAKSWTDNSGNFWLMGGVGFDAAGNFGNLNDLWVYNSATNQWTWVKGDDTINSFGIYGTKGIGNPSNTPGARYESATWTDGAGDFWLYGGYGFGESGKDRLSDLWKLSAPSLAALPVHLLEFKGRLLNDDGILNWKTENETNALNFIVERSIDRRNYFPVGTIAANNRSGIQQYNFTDPGVSSLGSAIIYYRLKQTDKDGKATYSNIIALTLDKSFLVLLYPNPVIQKANITITIDRSESVNIKIINQVGSVVKHYQLKLTAGSSSHSFDVSALAGGLYYLELSGETISKHISFMKQ